MAATAPDGSPAAYDKDNIPLRPKRHLKVNAGELNDGDFAMVMGFPGTTDRFLTSYGLEETMDVTNTLRHDIRDVKINILREEMASSQATRIKYASKYASCSNYWKYSSEQNKALKALNTMELKRQTESEYLEWARFQPSHKYREALDKIKRGYADRRDVRAAQMYVSEGLISGSEAMQLAASISAAVENYPDRDFSAYAGYIANFYKDYDEAVDQRVAAAMFGYVYAHMAPEACPEFLIKANKKYKGNWEKYIANLYKGSIFANQEAMAKFMEKPNTKKIEKDALVAVGNEVYGLYRSLAQQVSQESKDNLQRGIRDYTDGILKINKDRKFMAPDANSTIRLTYGNVMSYDPQDGVSCNYYTTMAGIIKKEDPNNSEFNVPERLKKLYAERNFGSYANRKGEMPACFITNNDITGGNSGSPVINGKGVLIGLAFDGNGEAMSGDIDFEENLQRCICLDSRYMLWVIDIYAGASNLIAEMDIVR